MESGIRVQAYDLKIEDWYFVGFDLSKTGFFVVHAYGLFASTAYEFSC